MDPTLRDQRSSAISFIPHEDDHLQRTGSLLGSTANSQRLTARGGAADTVVGSEALMSASLSSYTETLENESPHSFKLRRMSFNTQGSVTPSPTAAGGALALGRRRSGSLRRSSLKGALGLPAGYNSVDTGANICIGHQTEREVLNGLSFPKVVSKKIPRYQRRHNSDSYILQVFVDLLLRPENPLLPVNSPDHVCIAAGGERPGSTRGPRSPGPRSPGPGSPKRKLARRGSLNNFEGAMIKVPLPQWAAQNPRGPFPIRIALDATPEEAAEECVAVIQSLQVEDSRIHEQLLLQQQRHTDAMAAKRQQNKSATGSRSMNQSRRRTGPLVPLDDGGGIPIAVPKAAFQVTPGTLHDLDRVPEDGEGLALRRCDALGRSQTKDTLLNPSGLSLIQQLLPNVDYANNTLSLHVVLAPDPEFFSRQVRAKNLERLRLQQSLVETVERQRQENIDFLEEKRRLDEVDGILYSHDRDREVRKQIQVHSASAEVKHWRRDMLVQTKKSDIENMRQQEIAREKQVEDFYRALTKDAIHKELQYTEDHANGAAEIQGAEEEGRLYLLTECRELGRTIETYRRANERLLTVAASVERAASKEMARHW